MASSDRQRWNARHAARGVAGPPSPSLLALEGFLPRRGRALDVAGGAGRNALWLAARGLDVTVVDVSDAGLAIARAAAAAAGLRLATLALDLDEAPLPAGPWDLVFCHHFLERRAYASFAGLLAPGGTLAIVHMTSRNLERHAHPAAEWLLAPGELSDAARGLDIVHFDEDWRISGNHEAWLVARRGS